MLVLKKNTAVILLCKPVWQRCLILDQKVNIFHVLDVSLLEHLIRMGCVTC